MVEFANFTGEEREIVWKIVDRAIEIGIYDESQYMDAEMDLSATYFHCPLRLAELLAAPNFDFAHDIAGILRHINRETGLLENHFLPRFAQPQKEV